MPTYTKDTRPRNFNLVKRKVKALSSKSMKVLDRALLGDEGITETQIQSAGAILQLGAMFHLEEGKQR